MGPATCCTATRDAISRVSPIERLRVLLLIYELPRPAHGGHTRVLLSLLERGPLETELLAVGPPSPRG